MSPEPILISPGQPEERGRDHAGVLNTAPVLFNLAGRDGIQKNNPRFLSSSAEIIQKRADKNIKLRLIEPLWWQAWRKWLIVIVWVNQIRNSNGTRVGSHWDGEQSRLSASLLIPLEISQAELLIAEITLSKNYWVQLWLSESCLK